MHLILALDGLITQLLGRKYVGKPLLEFGEELLLESGSPSLGIAIADIGGAPSIGHDWLGAGWSLLLLLHHGNGTWNRTIHHRHSGLNSCRRRCRGRESVHRCRRIGWYGQSQR